VTVGEWIAITTKLLEEKGVTSPSLEARLLAASVVKVQTSELIAHPEIPIPEDVAKTLLSRRLKGEPLAYIIGKKNFWGREFAVDQRVLIPRQETELLVEKTLTLIKQHQTVVDVGTGSGCIAITLALEAQAHVIAVDVSTDAIEVAQYNAKQHQARVCFIKSDGLLCFKKQSLDIIVSNPPYVEKNDPHLQKEVAQWEPALALYAKHGIDFIRKLSLTAHQVLKPSGVLIFEFGYNQKTAVQQLLKTHYHYTIYEDDAKIPRCAMAWKK
jgi:release factor glutamine methyltransferase